MRKIVRNRATPEARAYWDSVLAAAKVVATWPDWRKAGINGDRSKGAP